MTAAVDVDGSAKVTVHSDAHVPLQAGQDLDGTAASISLQADTDTTIPLHVGGSGVHRLHLQILPNGVEFPDVVTLLVTTSEDGAIAGQAFVSET